ncbi:hypothetical protein SAMN03080594_103120 [Arenibacter palladensis]|uniref:WD40-like Beta Propeller Repeat n=1 Tax=Arenibacter palladensis TaxID=237373 RepID=A0A1M5A6W8_9FLAO|nr:copper resistance protein NlpE [Arenibacter palladensis]SHF26051.1 hypothetical protein SAMN03080594_103120 [Arenibacter palladensis]
MKVMTSILLLMSSFTLVSQADILVGEYFLSTGDKEKHLIEYTLTLNQNGTFHFHSYRNHKRGIPREEHKYGQGNWSLDGKIVCFSTDKKTDFDEKFTLDFSNSRARFIAKPLRDKTNRLIETKLQFFESEIPWIKRLGIPKK